MKKRRRLLALVLALALCAGCHDTSQEGQTETNDLGGTGETWETAATVPGAKDRHCPGLQPFGFAESLSGDHRIQLLFDPLGL